MTDGNQRVLDLARNFANQLDMLSSNKCGPRTGTRQLLLM